MSAGKTQIKVIKRMFYICFLIDRRFFPLLMFNRTHNDCSLFTVRTTYLLIAWTENTFQWGQTDASGQHSFRAIFKAAVNVEHSQETLFKKVGFCMRKKRNGVEMRTATFWFRHYHVPTRCMATTFDSITRRSIHGVNVKFNALLTCAVSQLSHRYLSFYFKKE